MSNFWEKLDKPFTVLAPMANVTDWAFRKVVADCGRPDVFFTEFVSADGMVYDKTRFERELYFEKKEKPIVAQFFGSKPENFYKVAQMAVEMGFDGIDINMGCPDRSVEKQGAGAALIKNPKLAQEIIKTVKRAVKDAGSDIPVSVKTRIGYNTIATEEWFPHLLEMEPAAIIIHGRTRKEMSAVPAHWDEIGKVAQMAKGTKTLVIGNGDVSSLAEAREKAAEYGLDGIMVGRGIFANPWFFNEKVDIKVIEPKERIALLKKHLKFFIKLWGNNKNFDTMKRFFKVYVADWPGAKDLRAELMLAKSEKQVFDILDQKGY